MGETNEHVETVKTVALFIFLVFIGVLCWYYRKSLKKVAYGVVDTLNDMLKYAEKVSGQIMTGDKPSKYHHYVSVKKK